MDLFCQGLGRGRFAVYEKRLFWRSVEAAQPTHDIGLIAVGRKRFDDFHVAAHRDQFPVNLEMLRPIEEASSTRPFRLIADEHERRVAIRAEGLEVVEDATAGHHAAPRDQDRRSRQRVELFRCPRMLHEVEVFAEEGIPLSVAIAVPMKSRKDLFMFLKVLGVDVGCVNAKRGVEIDRKCRVDHLPLLEFLDDVEDLLRASDGKGRNEDLAAAGRGCVNNPGESCKDIFLLMHLIAVSRFDHQIIRLGNAHRGARDQRIIATDVAGEEDPAMTWMFQGDLDES